MSVLLKIRIKIRNLSFKAKGMLYKIYLLSCGCKVGKGLKCKNFPIMRTLPHKNIILGNNVNIGYRVTLDISHSGKLIIGNRVNLTQDIIISALEKVEIGDDALIAENVSIRDGDHKFEIDRKINQQDFSKKAIKIGSDVWIGAGSRILKGSKIEEGCVVAANSIILEKTNTEAFNIYVGSPAKQLKKRD